MGEAVPGFLSVVALSRGEGEKKALEHRRWCEALAEVEAGFTYSKTLKRLRWVDKKEQVAARGGFTGFDPRHKVIWKRHFERRDRAYGKHLAHEQHLLEEAAERDVGLDSGRAEGSILRLRFRF